MASGGDIVPAISGSADPQMNTEREAAFAPLQDFLREGFQEQQQTSVAFVAVAGVYQSLHRLGKPDVMLVAVLKDSLGELLQRQEGGEKDDSRWELSKQVAATTYLGSPEAGFHTELGDEIKAGGLGAELVLDDNPRLKSPLRFGTLMIDLDRAGENALLAQIHSGGLGNHVNQAALHAALDYLQLCGKDQKS